MTQPMFTVEGSRPLLQMAAFSLRQAGYEMIEGGWQDGLNKARGQRVDPVLAEQNMPDMDGLCLIKALWTMKNYQNMPIVVLTTESGDAVQALGKVVEPMDDQAFRPVCLIEIFEKLIGLGRGK